MSYTIQQFNLEYPNDDVCLDEIFQNRYGNVKDCPSCGVVATRFYRVKARKCYACMHCGYQLHPLAGTIFHKSDTPLTKWFFAIYLFSNSKNGVSAKEVERHLGVTYKCAHRIARRVRMLMEQDDSLLSGIVEADETYVGGRRKREEGRSHKTPVLGLVERKGHARAIVAETASTITAKRFIEANLEVMAQLHSDESPIYHHVSRTRVHESINHAKGEYGRGSVTTNTIEGFWSQLKRSLDGTYHSVSPKYLQLYVNEFVYRYNHRDEAIYPMLMVAAAKHV
jgi:transposase